MSTTETPSSLDAVVKKLTEDFANEDKPTDNWILYGTIDKVRASQMLQQDPVVTVHLFVVGHDLNILNPISNGTVIKQEAIKTASRELFWSRPSISTDRTRKTYWVDGKRVATPAIPTSNEPGKKITYVIQVDVRVGNLN